MKKMLLVFALLAANAFASYSVREYKEPHFLGLKRHWTHHLNFLQTHRVMRLSAPAPVIGLYDLTPRVSPPEDQGNCGSCFDFSVTKALRSALMLVGKDPGRLAFNYILNNCGPVHEEGCSGGDFDAGQNMLNGLGPWLESQDPYTAEEGSCPSGLAVAGTALTWNTVGPGNRAPTFQELATAISQNHMLSIDVAVCGQWGNYSSGIFDENQCGAESINHMVNLVKYDCQTSVDANGNCVFDQNGQPKNGDGYLTVMNNWNTTWGEGGYMRTRYGVDAVANTAMYFDVK